ncbi:hypothetical protein KUTeg_004602 [Tegillarca granosa]|uniref:methenyltetrahydrofolate cyclohydrolase n=1 Tax=Tegillarca granosa TaxID=220873 RepID=A0ABQ9FTN4_TEGGR|nr:hypothetical protein KUTeg_004602 [Tegillarca granosa]
MKNEVKAEVDEIVASGGRRPHLCVLLVGKDAARISSESIKLPESTSQKTLLQVIDKLNKNQEVDGILVQLPVPGHINERSVCNAIDPSKDVDGFHTVNIGRFCADQQAFVPATPAGVMEIIRRTADATTTICHRYTPPEQLTVFTKTADILVVATGIPNLITADMVKEGVAVIDIGINRIKDEKTGKIKLVGDVDFEGVSKKASYITPVPGGVGPITVAMLMKNTMKAYRKEINFD